MNDEYLIHDIYSINEKGHFTLSGADTVELAEKYGTPLYLLSENKITDQCRKYINAMAKYFPQGSMPFYASKALSFYEIYKIIGSLDMGIDIVSPGELYTAARAGFDLKKAIFHGNNKTDADIEYGIECGIGYFAVDNIDELYALDSICRKHGIVQDILLRITPGIDPHTLKAISTGSVDSKFGSPIETGAAERITALSLSLKNVRLCGFHCHIGSQIFELEPFEEAGEVMIRFIASMRDKYGFEAKILNLGGGFGVAYVSSQRDCDIDSYIKGVAEAISSLTEKYNVNMPRIFMEPGRSIVGAAGVTLYTVGSYKEIEGFKNYVSIDGGMPDNPRYALYASQYTVLCANKANDDAEVRCTVGGRCCESGDLIAEDVMLQKVSRGDKIAVLVTGAYNYSMASNYNRIPKAPIVIVKDGVDRLSVRRQSFEDMLKTEIGGN